MLKMFGIEIICIGSDKMKKTDSLFGIFVIIFISISIMAIIDAVINPGYIYKSGIKIVMFFLIPLIYIKYTGSDNLKNVFKVRNNKSLLISIIIGLFLYMIILGAYFILKSFIELDSIKDILTENLNVNKNNFVFIALYISFINSLLEEIFFRGFIFLNLRRIIISKNAYIISALAFALYHIAIMGSWFRPFIFILAMIGLFIGGIIFNYLDESNENIYSSWIVHMMANFAINTVGFIMYGII